MQRGKIFVLLRLSPPPLKNKNSIIKNMLIVLDTITHTRKSPFFLELSTWNTPMIPTIHSQHHFCSLTDKVCLVVELLPGGSANNGDTPLVRSQPGVNTYFHFH